MKKDNTSGFYIWEIKNTNKLNFFTDIKKVNIAKKKRINKKSLMESYSKLISLIDKVFKKNFEIIFNLNVIYQIVYILRYLFIILYFNLYINLNFNFIL